MLESLEKILYGKCFLHAVIDLQSRHLRRLSRHGDSGVKERQNGLAISPGLNVVNGVGSERFNSCVAFGSWIQHDTLEQVEIERIRLRRLVVCQKRNLRITVVGFCGEHIEVGVQCSFVEAMLVIEVTKQHAVAQVERIFRTEFLDGLESAAVVVHGDVGLELFETQHLTLSLLLFQPFDGSNHAGVVTVLFVEPNEHAQVLRFVFHVGNFFIESNGFAEACHVGEIGSQRLFVGKVFGLKSHRKLKHGVSLSP